VYYWLDRVMIQSDNKYVCLCVFCTSYIYLVFVDYGLKRIRKLSFQTMIGISGSSVDLFPRRKVGSYLKREIKQLQVFDPICKMFHYSFSRVRVYFHMRPNFGTWVHSIRVTPDGQISDWYCFWGILHKHFHFSMRTVIRLVIGHRF
jgi:hypothetical protein